MRDVAAEKLVDTGAIGALRRQRPGRRQHLGQCGLGFLGQHQAAQAALLVGQGGGDRVMTIQPDGAFRRVGTRPRTILLARALIVTLPVATLTFAGGAIGTLMKRLTATLGPRVIGTRRPLIPRPLIPRPLIPRPLIPRPLIRLAGAK